MIKKIFYLLLISALAWSFVIFEYQIVDILSFDDNLVGKLLRVGLVLFTFIPISSYLYTKLLVSKEKKKLPLKILLSVICSLTVAFPSAIVAKEIWGYSLLSVIITFAWCELWSLLGLVKFKSRITSADSEWKNKGLEGEAEFSKAIESKEKNIFEIDGFKKKVFHLYWLWMPIFHCLAMAFGFFVFNFWLESTFAGDWGGIPLGVLFMMFYSLLISPLMSIIYSKKIRAIGWKKYLCVIYNALVMGMYMPICYMPLSLEYFAYTLISFPFLIVFIPALLCGIITLIVYDVRIVLKTKRRKHIQNKIS